MKLIPILLIFNIILLSCKKDKVSGGETVEIYLLKTSQTVPGKCQIDAAASSIQDTPEITNDDILEYSQIAREFKLSAIAIQKVKAFHDFTPFAVTVDRKVIYYGFFKPGISSSSCTNSITMDISLSSGNKIVLRLGYPAAIDDAGFDDQRNNSWLLGTLEKQGKLRP
ncbi:hypothetical protein A3860_09710 [Niastella vici]|uniref:Lipoprotein n=1 Tax=Niastella vici TaxID=1703345 RepID=A0A1V9FES1_9BACT|nr:hypothetical protein [Niastella vici]OQP56850.1 hypothetical protein A3860_09710 [Niastella vici]